MTIPKDVGLDDVHASPFCRRDEVGPHLGVGSKTESGLEKEEAEEEQQHEQQKGGWRAYGGDAARVVNGGGDEELALAVDDEGAVVEGDIARDCNREEEEEEKGKREDEEASVLGHGSKCNSSCGRPSAEFIETPGGGRKAGEERA